MKHRRAVLMEQQRERILQRRLQNYYVNVPRFSLLTLSASNPVECTQDPQQPQQLLQFNNPEVIAKMRNFYNDMAALQSVKCLICFEQFPSIFYHDEML